MYRGTTPAFTFTLPIDTTDISLVCSIQTKWGTQV
jgi:hypothetical protein